MAKISFSQIALRDIKSLSKKYPSFEADMDKLVLQLETTPDLGVELGGGFRKIRLAIKSKNKGKRGGMRVITLNLILAKPINSENKEVVLFTIYDKSETSNILVSELKELGKKLGYM